VVVLDRDRDNKDVYLCYKLYTICKMIKKPVAQYTVAQLKIVAQNTIRDTCLPVMEVAQS
jgi:hypothetical protein